MHLQPGLLAETPSKPVFSLKNGFLDRNRAGNPRLPATTPPREKPVFEAKNGFRDRLLVLPLLFASALPAVQAEAPSPRPGPAPLAAQLPGLHLLEGPWREGSVHRESVCFLRGRDGKATAALLFDAERILAVHTADGTRDFEAGRDYQLSPDGARLIAAPGSGIPILDETELFRPEGAANRIGHRAGHPETGLLFGEGHFFHDRQVEVSYVPRRPAWNAGRPSFAGDRLPHTLERLAKQQPLTLAVSGDSISQGYNASGSTNAPPFMPPYPDLVAAQLERSSGARVTLVNRAIAGWSSGQGVNDLDKLLARSPDLVVIAYGMNDVGGRNPAAFQANIATMLTRIHAANPATEVILVAPMTGNPEWAATPPEMFPRYRDALAALEGPGVVLADLTAVWRRLLARKRYTDLTGNGVNHPNDYGHRVYAQAILALLVEPDSVPRRRR